MTKYSENIFFSRPGGGSSSRLGQGPVLAFLLEKLKIWNQPGDWRPHLSGQSQWNIHTETLDQSRSTNTHKKCSIITSKFQLKILMDDLRKSPQFVKIHNWCEFLKCWNKIPKRCLLLSLTWRIFYNSEQIFYWEKYFLLSQKWSKEEYLCVHRVSSPFNWNLKLTFIEFTVATKRCFLTQKKLCGLSSLLPHYMRDR